MIRTFNKGLSKLQRMTGTEHNQTSCFLLIMLADARLTNNASFVRVIQFAQVMLDFVFVAQYPIHTSATLGLLQDALRRIHKNKEILFDLGIRDNFNFKFH